MRQFFGSVFVQEDDHQEDGEHIELAYYIQETGDSYGIEIESSKPAHSGFASYSNITANYDEIVNFIQCLMENFAYPENLPEYVEDFLYEKKTSEVMGEAVLNA